LAIAGLVPLNRRECRWDNAGLDFGETAEHLPDLGQWPLNLFSAITNAERPTGKPSLSNGKKPRAAGGGFEIGHASLPAETANQRQKIQSGRERT
jgi:hypothetical protein